MSADDGDVERERLETISAFLLGVATVAAAVCAYQATLWSGAQIRSLTLASSRQLEVLRHSGAASREQIADVTTFLDLLQAAARGDARTAALVRARVRDEIRPALETWIWEGRALGRSSKPALAGLASRAGNAEVAARMRTDMASAVDAARRANVNGDLLVLHAVFLALALFFLGLTTQVRRRAVRRTMLIFGAVVLVAGVVSMLQVPRPGQRDAVTVL